MHEKHVVVIGGGPGTDVVLLGLKRYTSRLTALVSTFDASSRRQWLDGQSDGHAADEVRSSLLALGADPATTNIMERLFSYRLGSLSTNGSGTSELTFGSLFLSALIEITGGTDLALRAAARVLNVQGEVLPMTLHHCALIADLDDSTSVPVTNPAELSAAAEGVGLRGVRLAYPAPLLEASVQAIESADIIVLGPTDLHFGLLAPLQLQGMLDALAASQAVKIFVCNIMTQRNTTAGWPASRFIHAVLNHLDGAGPLDCVIVNSAPLAPSLLDERARAGSLPVNFDIDECLSLGLNVIVRPVSAADSLLHDPEKLARTILFLGGGRSARRGNGRRLFDTTPLNTGPLNEVLGPGTGPLLPRGAES